MANSVTNTSVFSEQLLAWFDLNGRKDLPWQQPATPYRVWVSEIMLQQTQVATVIPYFNRFIERFPSVQALAQAEQAEVLHYWSGLGYYARGRNLHRSAQAIMTQYQGELPQTAEQLVTLSGIGQSTAHAILSLAYHQPKAICDGNVKRVLARYLALAEVIDRPAGLTLLWQTAEVLQSQSRPADYTQAIMDLGATLCTRRKPRCHECPVQQNCQALRLAQSGQHPVTEFPRKSLKASKPERTCDMYLLQHPDGGIWLNAPQQEQGIWGGLYQLPQTLPQSLAVSTDTALTTLPSLWHVFTHFKLHIQPYWLTLSPAQAQQLTTEEQGNWYHPDESQLARPAIVDKLIRLIARSALPTPDQQTSLQFGF
jgi:A/G-specific adenine glycosylase